MQSDETYRHHAASNRALRMSAKKLVIAISDVFSIQRHDEQILPLELFEDQRSIRPLTQQVSPARHSRDLRMAVQGEHLLEVRWQARQNLFR